MRILHLTLKKKWFDMIASGEKKEEYREMTGYWIRRLLEFHNKANGDIRAQRYDLVRFRNGYRSDSPVMDVELVEIRIVKDGNSEWGWERECFGIKIGKVISISNY